MKLSPLVQSFVFHFGEMGSRWGINRTVGQIYALIYLSEKPLNADQLVEALGFSRSNIAMGIKELVSMNLVMLRHIPSDRKDYYTTHEDIWEIVRNLVEERKKREIDPTLSMLRSVLLQEQQSGDDSYALQKMSDMHDLIELLVSWLNEMQTLKSQRLVKLLKLGSGVNKILDLTDRVSGKS